MVWRALSTRGLSLLLFCQPAVQVLASVHAYWRRAGGRRALREEHQRGGVSRAYDGEVPVVEGGELGQLEPLGERDDGGVHCAQR